MKQPSFNRLTSSAQASDVGEGKTFGNLGREKKLRDHLILYSQLRLTENEHLFYYRLT